MNVLILSASVGSGHMRAAQAIEAAVRELEPRAAVRVVDVLETADRAFRGIYDRGYLGLAFSAPHLWGFLYDVLDEPSARGGVSETLRRFIQYWSLRDMAGLLRGEPWDVLVHTHFLPAETAAMLRRRGASGIPQITVVTDFEAHRMWVHDPTERYVVATREAAAVLLHGGVPEERIQVSGIPIHPLFSRLPDREECRRSLRIAGDRPVLLQLAGGHGKGPMDQIYARLLHIDVPAEIVVVTGRNEELRLRLARAPKLARHRVRVLGYADRIQDLMTAADLIVTKPGGLTSAEALACGLPMVLVQPIPGQESRNGDFLLESGAAVKVNALPALTEKVSALLKDPARLASMRAHARRASRPDAAFAVARRALEFCRRAISPGGQTPAAVGR